MNKFLKRRRNRSGRSRRFRLGATAIEFAMVAPAFVVIICISAEFARLSMVRNLAQTAAYEAARYVMTEGATVEDGIERANQILSRLGAVSADVTINGSDGSVDEEGNVVNEIQFDTTAITCNITFTLHENSIIIPASVFGDTQVHTQMTVRTERYRGYYDGQSTD